MARADRDEILATPLYDPTEAARLVGLTVGQVNRWLFGYSYRYLEEIKRQSPIVRRQLITIAARRASFLDLIELRAARLFLDRGASAQKVRKVFSEVQERCEEPFPFAMQRVRYAHGRFFLEVPEVRGLLELLANGQWAIEPVLRSSFEQLDYDKSGLADTWWPLGKQVPVKITPRSAFGAPTVKSRSLKTAVVYDLYQAEGNNTRPVARWFEMPEREVIAAVRFERGLGQPHAAAA